MLGPRADMLRTRAEIVFAKPLAQKRPMAAWNPTLYETQDPHAPQYVETSSPMQTKTIWNPQVYEVNAVYSEVGHVSTSVSWNPTLYATQGFDLPKYEVVASNAQNLTLLLDLAQYETNFSE